MILELTNALNDNKLSVLPHLQINLAERVTIKFKEL